MQCCQTQSVITISSEKRTGMTDPTAALRLCGSKNLLSEPLAGKTSSSCYFSQQNFVVIMQLKMRSCSRLLLFDVKHSLFHMLKMNFN